MGGRHPLALAPSSEPPLDPGLAAESLPLLRPCRRGFACSFPCWLECGHSRNRGRGKPRAPRGGVRETQPANRGASQELLQAALKLPAEMPFAANLEGEDDEIRGEAGAGR